MQREAMRRPISVSSCARWLAAGAVAVLFVTGSVQAEPHDKPDHRARIFAPNARPYGSTYEEWAVRYYQWSEAFPATADPASGTAPPESGQSGRVWFLPSVNGAGDTVTREITVPRDTALFASALAVRVNNTECPTDTQLTVQQLIDSATDQWSEVIEASITIDGVAIEALAEPQTTPYLLQTGAFPVTLADHDNLEAAGPYPCVPDGATITPNVALGAFVMIKPLPRGDHTIRLVAVVGPADNPAFFKDITYKVYVVDKHHGESR